MSTTSFISNDPTYDLATTSTSTAAATTEPTEASKPRESDEVFATGSGRDIIVSRDDKDKD